MSFLLSLTAPQCVLGSLVLAFVPHFVRTYGYVRPKLSKAGKTYDIGNPRAMVAMATDSTPEGAVIARLTGAHNNSLEAFSYFSAAVAMALLSGVPREEVDSLARTFLGIRAAYLAIYSSAKLNGVVPLRSLAFIGGLITCGALLMKAADAYAARAK